MSITKTSHGNYACHCEYHCDAEYWEGLSSQEQQQLQDAHAECATTLAIAATFGELSNGEHGMILQCSSYRELAGFFTKLDQLGRKFVGPFDVENAWAVIYPWQD